MKVTFPFVYISKDLYILGFSNHTCYVIRELCNYSKSLQRVGFFFCQFNQ